jgi:hypothetical protein
MRGRAVSLCWRADQNQNKRDEDGRGERQELTIWWVYESVKLEMWG